MEIFQNVVRNQEVSNIISDSEYDAAFVKLAESDTKSFQDLEQKVKTSFDNNPTVLTKFAAWLQKLTLDKSKLIELSKNFKV